METRSPSAGKIATMVLFAFSCVGLLLFLWLSFGGTIPLGAQGYRVRISFPFAQQVATQSDVRIAGVTVGKVVSKQLDPQGNRTIVTLELRRKYAPLHTDARAILRVKTILGETYIGLTPGSPNAPALRDNALLSRASVRPAVQLDQIFDAFDPTTRRAFQVWQQELSRAIVGNDQNLNDVLGNLPAFAASASDVLQVLDVQHQAVQNLFSNGATVFASLSQDPAALRNVITSGETVFHTTALQQNALAETFRLLPSFQDQSKATLAQLQTFSQNADPLFQKLIPVAQQLSPTLQNVNTLSPYLRQLFDRLGPLITVSKTGLPATSRVLNGAGPLLTQLGPFLEQLNPILNWLALHQQLTSDFISNGAGSLAATTSTFSAGGMGHYLRQIGPTGSETLGLAANRDANNRGNDYPPPLWLSDPKVFTDGGLDPSGNSTIFPAWDCKNTGAGGDGSTTANTAQSTGHPACWVAPPLPGYQSGPSKAVQIKPAVYRNR